jgi:hypothetical protein
MAEERRLATEGSTGVTTATSRRPTERNDPDSVIAAAALETR